MRSYEIIVLSVLECISLVLIVRLWRGKRKLALWQRCLFSIILLVPLVGWLLCGFLLIDPEAHSEAPLQTWE